MKKVAFDKTSTLTYGTPQIVAMKSLEPERDEASLYTLAAAAEQLSEHPLVRSWRQSTVEETLPPVSDFQMLPGFGVSAVVAGRTVPAGGQKLMDRHSVALPDGNREITDFLQRGCTVVYIAVDGYCAGCIALSDTVREESRAMANALHRCGATPVLLTEGNETAAGSIAVQLHIGEVRANCLPEDKLKAIGAFQRSGRPVCMIGDSTNDAPALKKAAVGIAMGSVGSNIAVDAADIALVNDEVQEPPHLLPLPR